MIINYSSENIISRRILIFFTTLCLWIICLNAYSLSLGRIKIQSSLNQPLAASIEILNAEDVLCEEILPNLASDQDFQLAKLKQPDFLVDIDFQVVAETKKKKVIYISTESVIQHPSIDLLVEVHWPMGRILKEYSILLNPLSVDSQDPVVAHTDKAAKKKIVVKNRQIASKESTTPTNQMQDDNFNIYYTKKGDTLWAIAGKFYKEAGLSIKETMAEIFKDNPDAFIDNNRTQLRSGYKLILPSKNARVREATKANINNRFDIKPADSVVKAQKNQIDQEPQAIVASKIKLADESNKVTLESETKVMQQQIASLKKQINELNKQKQVITDEVKSQQFAIPAEKEQLKFPEVSIKTNKNNKQTKLNNPDNKSLNSENIELEEGGFSFTFYLSILVILLAIIGASFVYYKRLKKHKQEHNLNNSGDEIVTDYSSEEASIPRGESNNKVTDPLAKADEFIQQKENDKAVLILNQALSINPNDPEINFKLLELYFNIGDVENAKKILVNCINIKNDDLNSKLNSLKAIHPEIFSDKQSSNGKWSIDDNDIALSVLDGDDPSNGNEPADTSGKRDELSFLEDSEFIDESIIDEISEDDSPSLKVSSKDATGDTEGEQGSGDDSESKGGKLDLAKGYIEMADYAEANKLLEEIIKSGSEDEQQQAEVLFRQIEDQQRK